MKEQTIQKQILDKLEALGHYNIKIITGNRAGQSDIISCSPTGRFWAIEVKKPGEVPSDLQWDHIRQVQACNGIAFYCDSLDDFLFKYKKCAVFETNCFEPPAPQETFVDL